ncbi:MAG TPA: ribosome biogenesis GTP-binding protein YihA/YsxC [Bacteroidia bacterium]|jgi:GTP-binding protein|nr:ribosome biogenesis GTP-binding protein YihA/YsxC [Bacteroidia bacterium]
MQITTADFAISSTDVNKCPKTHFPEFAFIGRSNVGKSSVINMICNKKVAHTSGKPGKTRLINHFLVNNAWYVVDLPGYGYASVSKTDRVEFEKFISFYILERKNLVCLFVLIDIRLPLQAIDAQFMQWLAENEIPFCIIFTKMDKLSKSELQKNLAAFKKEMLLTWEDMPDCIISSAEKKIGKEDILDFIQENILLYNKHLQNTKNEN